VKDYNDDYNDGSYRPNESTTEQSSSALDSPNLRYTNNFVKQGDQKEVIKT